MPTTGRSQGGIWKCNLGAIGEHNRKLMLVVGLINPLHLEQDDGQRHSAWRLGHRYKGFVGVVGSHSSRVGVEKRVLGVDFLLSEMGYIYSYFNLVSALIYTERISNRPTAS